MTFTPRPGALRYKNENNEWVCANPHDALYSTVTMAATQYYNGVEWKDIL